MKALETGAIEEATVVGWNRGGLLVQWQSLQGFLPASQFQQMVRYSSDAERDAAFASRVGEALQLKIIEVDRPRKRLVFSERATQWSSAGGQTTWEQVASGQVRRGRVRNLCDFGAFVDLGGIDGLVHISELSWRHIKHPADALQIGQEIDVYVMSVEPERKRVALSIKKLHPDPWEDIGARYAIGQTLQATITNVLSFGAFAHIEDGVEGLIHASELGGGGGSHPRSLVAEGDRVTVTIIGIDPAGRRLALSLRQRAE
ncbi:MAG: 30S ribosomal protein S1 [Anaerolineae bacterium]